MGKNAKAKAKAKAAAAAAASAERMPAGAPASSTRASGSNDVVQKLPTLEESEANPEVPDESDLARLARKGKSRTNTAFEAPAEVEEKEEEATPAPLFPQPSSRRKSARHGLSSRIEALTIYEDEDKENATPKPVATEKPGTKSAETSSLQPVSATPKSILKKGTTPATEANSSSAWGWENVPKTSGASHGNDEAKKLTNSKVDNKSSSQPESGIQSSTDDAKKAAKSKVDNNTSSQREPGIQSSTDEAKKLAKSKVGNNTSSQSVSGSRSGTSTKSTDKLKPADRSTNTTISNRQSGNPSPAVAIGASTQISSSSVRARSLKTTTVNNGTDSTPGGSAASASPLPAPTPRKSSRRQPAPVPAAQQSHSRRAQPPTSPSPSLTTSRSGSMPEAPVQPPPKSKSVRRTHQAASTSEQNIPRVSSPELVESDGALERAIALSLEEYNQSMARAQAAETEEAQEAVRLASVADSLENIREAIMAHDLPLENRRLIVNAYNSFLAGHPHPAFCSISYEALSVSMNSGLSSGNNEPRREQRRLPLAAGGQRLEHNSSAPAINNHFFGSANQGSNFYQEEFNPPPANQHAGHYWPGNYNLSQYHQQYLEAQRYQNRYPQGYEFLDPHTGVPFGYRGDHVYRRRRSRPLNPLRPSFWIPWR
ncbi:hypothetical protein BT63DRAFT_476410 [Microthyrium microscopicum]|uniref:Uncharacterized protein n=1 Tax=Microthyrium microscopicum TaxID=703497 RepID=A0A6A6USB9_9PEZI|nr:hypothetical protein BT63DRAFT_476410 [Microthyrium microscopicum]